MHERQRLLFAAEPQASEPRLPYQHPTPEDAPARRSAIDTGRSILVQAPAGAGKTNLLTQRYLALLAEVEEPEQILAITFTRAATAEMRQRIVQALEAARNTPFPEPGVSAFEGDEMPLARAAMRHADLMKWRLLEQPHRLDVQTIDSLCLRLAHGQPLLARLGGALQPAEDASALYARAARGTTSLLGQSGDPELEQALETLLLRRDNNLAECERLLATMLARRDAWLGVLPLGPADSVDWAEVRKRLEQPFADENKRVLRELCAAMETMPELSQELVHVARYAAGNLGDEFTKNYDLRLLRALETMPDQTLQEREQREHWLALASLLLTQDGGWRKRWTKNEGFPAAGTGFGKAERSAWNERVKDCCGELQTHAHGGEKLQQLLSQLRALPALHYSDDQWRTLLAVFRVLRRAVVELRLVFAEENAVDFVEIAQAAEAVLQDETSMRGLLESEKKQHVLIDEFQDTSRAQYRLVAELLREWSAGDKRTVFLVGDPLQSIYGFRQAEVALFHETRKHGLPCGNGRRHLCHALQLTHNFRSHQSLVEALNEHFEKMFAGGSADTFVPAHAWSQDGLEKAMQLHTFFVNKDADPNADPNANQGANVDANRETGWDGDRGAGQNSDIKDAFDARQGQRDEAAAVVRVLQAERPRIAAAEAAGELEYRVAILVRSRSHLAEILPALRAAAIPYRAVELESLSTQPEVHDLLLLLRALLHAADRVAWLSVLRAPWCGLLLRDLHLLAGGDDPALLRRPVIELIETRAALLSPDGQARLHRTANVLEQALRTRYSEGNNLSLAAWLERTWMALGGPACLDDTARENAEAFLRLLDGLEPSGVDVLRGDFALRLEKLCAAPDTRVSERFGVQLMTMHKAKGLGFQVVLLPGLDREAKADSTELLAMLQRAHAGDTLEMEVLVAPVGSREDEEADRNYAWVVAQKKKRDAEERKRLFYMACTRARTRLHLFARVEVSKGEVVNPRERSLLGSAWPAFRDEVQDAWKARETQPVQATELTMPAAISSPGVAQSLAAAAEEPARISTQLNASFTSQTMSQAHSQTILQLPSSWTAQSWALDVKPHRGSMQMPRSPLFVRSEGSLAARARGTAMHALLERLAAKFAEAAQTLGTRELESWRPDLIRMAEQALRLAAFPRDKVRATAVELAAQALAVAANQTGRWLLTPHAGALAESAWQSWDADGNLRTLRVDRSFLAGNAPGEAGESYLWIVDYKTGARAENLTDQRVRTEWLTAQKAAWQPQLEAYGAALTAAGSSLANGGQMPLRYGLFFPELLELLIWNGEPD